jgi:hypothetical protein
MLKRILGVSTKCVFDTLPMTNFSPAYFSSSRYEMATFRAKVANYLRAKLPHDVEHSYERKKATFARRSKVAADADLEVATHEAVDPVDTHGGFC